MPEVSEPVLGPPFVPGRGPTTSAWREEALVRANELEGVATWIESRSSDDPIPTELLSHIREQLLTVRITAAKLDQDHYGRPLGRWAKLKAAWGGAAHQRVLGNLDAVETTLFRVAPPSYVCGEMPSLVAHVNRFLPKADPRRMRVERLATKAETTGETTDLSECDREVVIAAFHAGSAQRRRDLLRVSSFRNVMLGAAATLVPLAVALAVFGAVRPTAIPLCFFPVEKEKVVCPTAEVHPQDVGLGTPLPAEVDIDPFIANGVRSGDITLIEIIGLIAAVVASTIALRNIRGTSTPYGLAVALALLKLPLGALTAVLGLLLMSGGFVPGLSALDSSAQILAWALVFGFSQQLLTRLVDQRASTLLDNVGGRGAAGDRAKSSD
jgi:hypothetical protein